MIFLERDFIIDRNKFIDIFLRLNQQEIELHINKISKFRSSLDKNGLEVKYFDHHTQEEFSKTDLKTDITSSTQTYKLKHAGKKRINLSVIKVFAYNIFLIILILAAYLTNFSLMTKQKQAMTSKIEMLVDNNFVLYQMAYVFFETYEYIGSNGTARIRGKLISEEWNTLFNDLANMQDKFIRLIDVRDGLIGDPNLVVMTKGNLCMNLASSPYAGAQCAKLLYGTVTKGVVQLNSFMMSLTSRIKTSFDDSPRTKDDMIRILKDQTLIQSESVWGLYLFPAFARIDQIIRDHLKNDFEDATGEITVAVVVYILAINLCGLMVWWKVRKTIREERSSWRRMARLIPINMVANNKMLRSYIFKGTKSTLGSIKTYFKRVQT